MAKFEIEGPNRLSGEIVTFGAKNAALKMIAAAVLISGEAVLENIPQIEDIKTLSRILVANGARIDFSGHRLIINTANLTEADPDPKLVKKMRASIVLAGPYLARFGRLNLPQPGGDAIGSRPIDIHLDGFKKLGVNVNYDGEIYHLSCDKLTGNSVNLRFASVTATENVLMAAVLAKGTTIINNAAREPEIADLANFLNGCGAKIRGAGASQIKIEGVDKLTAGRPYRVMPDRIEAGTWVALSLITKSPLKITHCQPEHLTAYLAKIEALGGRFEKGSDFLYIKDSPQFEPVDIATAVYPGFPTDLQAPFGLLLSQTPGQSRIKETIFENRFGYLKELAEMGVKAEIISPHEAKIFGSNPLRGAKLDSIDIRAGATLILAGLAAEGKTIINNAEIIDRGYEKIEERLQKIGAKITRV